MRRSAPSGSSHDILAERRARHAHPDPSYPMAGVHSGDGCLLCITRRGPVRVGWRWRSRRLRHRVDPTCTVGVGGRGWGGRRRWFWFGWWCLARMPEHRSVRWWLRSVSGGRIVRPVAARCFGDVCGVFEERVLRRDVERCARGLKVASVARLTPAQTASVNKDLQGQGCPPMVTPASLAQRAYRSITFPRPSGDRTPSTSLRYQGLPFTYVNLWTFFFTSPGTWRTLSATASAAGMSATVTARPVRVGITTRAMGRRRCRVRVRAGRGRRRMATARRPAGRARIGTRG